MSSKDAKDWLAQRTNSSQARENLIKFCLVSNLLSFISFATIFVASLSLNATVIRLPEEELARDSVLPVFDRKVAVRDRNVVTEGRIELGGFGGFNLNEAFYTPYNFGAYATYHFNEIHGFNLMANFYMDGTSSYADQLKNGEGLGGPGNGLDLARAPSLKYMVLGNYQLTAYYGKISLSKSTVTNVSLYGLAGAGAIGIGDETTFGLNVGLGQKFYFSPNAALRFDLRFITYQAPNPLSVPLSNGGPDLPNSAFEETWVFTYLLTVGAVFLLP